MGRDAFLALLADEGVNYLFGNPGTTELPIMAALSEQSSIEFVLGLQESIVVAMADGYSRASGKLSACNVHVAPGLGNAIGSIFNAHWIGSPVIVTAGQQETGHGLTEPLLYGPMLPMASPVVKWSIEVTRLQDLPRIMRRAATIATTPPTGPVFVSLPGDILNSSAAIELGMSTRVDARTQPSQDSTAAMAERLLAAQNLVIIAGHELAEADSLREAAKLAETLNVPVYQQTVAHGAHFLSEHPCYMGGLSRSQSKVRQILEPFDTALFLGADVLRMSVYSHVEPLPSHVKVLQISARPAELGKNYATEIAINANIKQTLIALLSLLDNDVSNSGTNNAKTQANKSKPAIERPNWLAKRKKLVDEIDSLNIDTNQLITPDQLMLEITRQLPADAVVVDEALTTSQKLLDLYPYRDAKNYFGLASGGIGFAMAGVIGMQLAQPARPHVAIVGDGSSLYSIQALWTAANMQLPITYVIANNKGYQIIKDRLRLLSANAAFIGMDFDQPEIDFVQLARSMGLQATSVTRSSEIGDALQTAIRSNDTWLVDVHVGP